MTDSLRLLTKNELSTVSGGHGGAGWFMFFLGLPHLLIGIREFTNYAVDFAQNGCEELEEDDHFSKGLCLLKNVQLSSSKTEV